MKNCVKTKIMDLIWRYSYMHIEHIAMYVNNLEKAKDFFDVLLHFS